MDTKELRALARLIGDTKHDRENGYREILRLLCDFAEAGTLSEDICRVCFRELRDKHR